MTTPDPVVQMDDVRFQWTRGGEFALNGLSLTVERGEAIGLLGRNGAGKTTLLRTLTGQIAAQAGGVRVFGLDPMEEGTAVRRRIGFVAETDELPDHLSVARIVDLHRSLFPSWDDALCRELQARFPVPGNKTGGQLSKGQARQVALVCALSHRPELLLLDEPASGLDPAMRREFLETAIEFLDERTTLLFSSHHVQDVERLAGRVVVLAHGRVLIDAATEALQEEHCVLRVARDEHEELSRELTTHPDCVRVRRHKSELHAVLRGDPARHADWLLASGIDATACRAASLEDLFVELVGRES